MASVFPNVLLCTKATLSERRRDNRPACDSDSVELIIVQLMPESYGVIVRKSGAEPTVIHSIIVDEHAKISAHERCRGVDLEIYDHEAGACVVECHLEFLRNSDWLDCMHLLTEAKSQHARRAKLLRYNLTQAGLEQYQLAAHAEDEPM